MWQRGYACWRTAGRPVNWAFLWGDAWAPFLRVISLTRATVCFPEPLTVRVFTHLFLCLVSELQSGHWDTADKIHLSLMVDHVTEVSHWMVGVKRLIAETRKLSPELLEPLRKSEADISAEPVQPVQESGSPSWLSFRKNQQITLTQMQNTELVSNPFHTPLLDKGQGFNQEMGSLVELFMHGCRS